MNKKSILGHALTFYVFVALIVLIILYISLATFSSASKKDLIQNPEVIYPSNELLFKTIKIEINGKEKEMFVLDAIALERKGNIGRNQIAESIQFLIEENTCVVLHVGSTAGNLAIFDYKKQNGEIILLPEIINYENFLEELEIKVKSNNDEEYSHKIKYYYGECL